MATYAELLTAEQNAGLNNKVRVAIVVAAEVIRTESEATPKHAERLAWAAKAFLNPEQYLKPVLWALLAQNKAATLAQITGATDETVQTAVNSAVNVFTVA